MTPGKRRGEAQTAGPGAKSLRGLTRLLKSGLPIAVSLAVLPGFFWPAYQYVERNDGGFRYRDYKGSPYDQIRTPDKGINQIQCPPPQRPLCGGK